MVESEKKAQSWQSWSVSCCTTKMEPHRWRRSLVKASKNSSWQRCQRSCSRGLTEILHHSASWFHKCFLYFIWKRVRARVKFTTTVFICMFFKARIFICLMKQFYDISVINFLLFRNKTTQSTSPIIVFQLTHFHIYMPYSCHITWILPHTEQASWR